MKKRKTRLCELANESYGRDKRLIAPLVGFPGSELISVSIKVAQQNYGVHFDCINALAERLGPDVAFIMMDLSVEANALGLPVRFPLDESSTVEKHPLNELSELEAYRRISILQDARVQSYVRTVEMMSMGLPDEVLTCAFVTGPLTLAGLLESAERVAMDSILEPRRLHTICDFATEVIQEYAQAFVNAGADIICVLEPTASILGPEQFRQFSARYVHHILDSYKYSGVETLYHTCGNTMHLVKPMVESGVAGLSLDSPEAGVDLARAAEIAGEEVVVMGNVNPTRVIKDGSVADVVNVTRGLLERMQQYPNFVLSTACDIPPGVPFENIEAFMQAGRQFRPMHAAKV